MFFLKQIWIYRGERILVLYGMIRDRIGVILDNIIYIYMLESKHGQVARRSAGLLSHLESLIFDFLFQFCNPRMYLKTSNKTNLWSMAPWYAKFTVGRWRNGWPSRGSAILSLCPWNCLLQYPRNKYDYNSFSLIFACEFVVHEFNQDKMFEVVISKGFWGGLPYGK
jgi:hypothetical protein